MTIAVDVDGVLADQVTPVLDIIKDEYGVTMKKEDVKSWDEPIPGTSSNVKIEIEDSHKDDNHVLSMPVIDDARNVLHHIKSDGHVVVIATNRINVSRGATEQWLVDNDIPYDSFFNINGGSKSDVEADVIIDDYPPNVNTFISESRYGILFLQPWNRSDSCLNHSRVHGARGWTEVYKIIRFLARL